MTQEAMKAVVIRELGGPEVLEVREVPRPEPGPLEIRVRVAASGVNRADLLQRRGRYPVPPGYPTDIPGIEYAGVVEAVGPGVRAWAPGDAVMGIVGGGGYAEAVVVHEGEAIPVPAGIEPAAAGGIAEAWLTAWDALVLQGGLQGGETVLIHAVGSGVGTAALQLARAVGARTVGTSRTPAKLERARALGLDVAIPGGGRDWPERVRAATGGRGVDVVLDLIGGDHVGAALDCLAERGRILVVGVPAGPTTALDLRRLMGLRASITGTVLRARPRDEKIALARAARRRLIPLMERSGAAPVEERTFAPDEAAAAHRMMESNLNFGTLSIVWGPGDRAGSPPFPEES